MAHWRSTLRKTGENAEVKYTKEPARNVMSESVHRIAVRPQ